MRTPPMTNTRLLKQVIVAALAGAALVSPQPALVSAHESYTVQVPVGDPTPPPYTPHTCTDQSWNSPIVKVHTSEIPHSSDTPDLVNAIDQVNAQVANVGG